MSSTLSSPLKFAEMKYYIYIFLIFPHTDLHFIAWIIQGVHFAELLVVQNILSADTGTSRQSEGHSFGDQSVLRHRVLQKLLLSSVPCLYDSCESMSNQPARWTPDIRQNNIKSQTSYFVLFSAASCRRSKCSVSLSGSVNFKSYYFARWNTSECR
jgi:hypothetical protein